MLLKNSNSAPLYKIWALLLPSERRETVVLLALIFIGVLLETLGVGMVVPAIALLMQEDFAAIHPSFLPLLEFLGGGREALVTGGMLLLVGIYLIKALFFAALYWKQSRFAFDLQTRLSQQMFELYMRQPYAFHLQRNSAKLISNISGEVASVVSNGVIPGMLLLTESLVLLGVGVMLLVFEPVGALIVSMVLGVSAWLFHFVTRQRIAQWGIDRHHHDVLRMQHMQQGLGGIKDVKLLGREDEFLKQFYRHNFRGSRIVRKHSVILQLPRLWLELLAVGGLAILVISMLQQNKPIGTILPALGLFAAAAFRLLPSVNRILNTLQSLRFGSHAISIVYDELQLDRAMSSNSDIEGPQHFSEALQVTRIGYAYEGASKPALSDITLTVQCGESVGFIGHSGSGKSTLIDILLGLLVPDVGTVEVDGKDISQNMSSWQRQIGYVPQSIYLTDDSLRRNIAFGMADEAIDDEAVRKALQAAQLDEFVAALPEREHTIVGERGIRLSGGQRQRIGIARALYHNPNVLVLDEATSALDNSTEQEVMGAVKALKGKKTILIVAHRLSTVMHCDRLYRLQSGKIVSSGAPERMIALEAGA